MAHFYGSITGQAGQATRMGSRGSGYVAWAQTYTARMTLRLWHSNDLEHPDHGNAEGDNSGDQFAFSIGGGHSTYYSGRSICFNGNNVAAALDSGDPKINAIWERITKEFKRLDDEAVPALQRVERKRKAAQRKREREERAAHKQRMEIMRLMKPEEKARLTRVTDINFDAEGNIETYEIHKLERLNLRYGANTVAHVLITATPKGAYQLYDFDLTEGQWILPFSAEDLGIEGLQRDTGYGYRIERDTEEVTA